MKLAVVLALVTLAVASCSPFIPVTNLNEVPPDQMRDALNVRLVRTGAAAAPKVIQYLGQVAGNSCKFLATDPPPTTNDALLRMRVEAAKRGANVVMDVTCNESGPDSFGELGAGLMQGRAVKGE